jgi:hypothetical protein
MIKIQERHKSITLLGNFKYLEENSVNPNINKLIFNENIRSLFITAYRIKKIVKKMPDKVIRYAIIKIKPIDLIFGKNEYTIKNKPIASISTAIVNSKGRPTIENK